MRPRFRDQSAISETGFVGAEVVKNLVDDFDRYVNCSPIALEAVVCELLGAVKTGRELTVGIFGVPIGTGDEKEKRALVRFIRSNNVVLFMQSDQQSKFG